MADILSQQEIDELLTNLSSGNILPKETKQEQAEKKIGTYDFHRPNRFSKDQIRTLEMMHENFSRLLSSSLSAHLRTMVEVKLLYVQEISYAEFISSIHNPTVAMVVWIEQLNGEMLLEINPTLAFAIVERLLGGTGSDVEAKRPLTEIEQVIILRITNQILLILKEAWNYVLPLEGKIERLETNPQFVQTIAGNEMIALVSLEVLINETRGLLNLCFPYVLLKTIAGSLTAHHWFSKSEEDKLPAGGVEALLNQIIKVLVPVVVELAQTTITAGELLHLQVGDVIPLDKRATGELDVLIGDQVKFRARPGTISDRLAVEITAVRKEGEQGE